MALATSTSVPGSNRDPASLTVSTVTTFSARVGTAALGLAAAAPATRARPSVSMSQRTRLGHERSLRFVPQKPVGLPIRELKVVLGTDNAHDRPAGGSGETFAGRHPSRT